MSTYRERREARAERLREWAEKREAKSAAAFRSAHEGADMIPFGQPILVGHHSEKRHRRDLGRIDSAMGRGVEHARKAESMQSRAGNIESQLERSIYSDDPDAIPALERRVAALEAKREQINADNAAFRKAVKAAGLPKESTWKEARFQGHRQHPSYELSNLSGDLKRNRDRLEMLRRQAARRPPARVPEPPPGPPGQMAMFRRKRPHPTTRSARRTSLETERRRRARQAKGQGRRRDGRFK